MTLFTRVDMNVQNQTVFPVKILELNTDDFSAVLKFKGFSEDTDKTFHPKSAIPKVLYLIYAIEHNINSLLTSEFIDEDSLTQRTWPNGWTALHYACDFGSVFAVSTLLEHFAHPHSSTDDGIIPLTLAARKGHVEIVRLLLEASPQSVNQVDIRGETPFFHLVQRWSRIGGSNSIVLSTAYCACAVLMLSSGADPSIKNIKDSMNAMHLAAQMGKSEIIELILNRCPNFDVNISDKDGDTPLMLNCIRAFNPNVVVLLRKAGADVALTNHKGIKAEEMLGSNKKSRIIKTLLEVDLSNIDEVVVDAMSPPMSPVRSPRLYKNEVGSPRRSSTPSFDTPVTSPCRGFVTSPVHSPPSRKRVFNLDAISIPFIQTRGEKKENEQSS
ncbi:hypothetical protein RCL1_008070 [Eukaryota sp. TZLM3-RCL]